MNAQCTFIQDVIEQAKKDPKHIIFPEGEDERILEAAHILVKEKIAEVTILGNEQSIVEYYKGKNYDSNEINIIDPSKSEEIPHFVELFYLLRKHKGVTLEKAKETVKQNNYFGTLMLYEDKVDALISGASHSTPQVNPKPPPTLVKAQSRLRNKDQAFPFLARRSLSWVSL